MLFAVDDSREAAVAEREADDEYGCTAAAAAAAEEELLVEAEVGCTDAGGIAGGSGVRLELVLLVWTLAEVEVAAAVLDELLACDVDDAAAGGGGGATAGAGGALPMKYACGPSISADLEWLCGAAGCAVGPLAAPNAVTRRTVLLPVVMPSPAMRGGPAGAADGETAAEGDTDDRPPFAFFLGGARFFLARPRPVVGGFALAAPLSSSSLPASEFESSAKQPRRPAPTDERRADGVTPPPLVSAKLTKLRFCGRDVETLLLLPPLLLGFELEGATSTIGVVAAAAPAVVVCACASAGVSAVCPSGILACGVPAAAPSAICPSCCCWLLVLGVGVRSASLVRRVARRHTREQAASNTHSEATDQPATRASLHAAAESKQPCGVFVSSLIVCD